ncbi:MAG: hypothetical protein U5R06_01575 [candidate division KSB1 bacterium]|nr:hypothetical protein [candidate division KSB1 bacterium]
MTDNEIRLFENLALKHMDKLYSQAIRLAGSTETAESLVQQTYKLSYWRFEQFDKTADFEKWLIRNLAFIWARTRFQGPLIAEG